MHNHLYYTSGIEWSASAMEMSVIAAKNIANMAHRDWTSGLSNKTATKVERVINEEQNNQIYKNEL